MKLAEASEFIAFAEEKILKEKLSPDAVCGRVSHLPDWQHKVKACTRTLYHYIDLGILKVRNTDLPKKLRYNTKKSEHRVNIKHLGESIDNRPESIQKRRQFGHWKIDTIVGKKSREDDALLILVERKTRFTLSMKIDGEDPDSVSYALKQLKQTYGCAFKSVFKTITADNGSEFSGLMEALKDRKTKVYYTHPYSSWERVTNERHNGMIRRFIQKTPIHFEQFTNVYSAGDSYHRSFVQKDSELLHTG